MGRSWNPRNDMPDLHGKVAVVTGANSGIGLETVKYLSLSGAKVYFTARSESKANVTREYVSSQNPMLQKDDLVWLPMELSDVKSILSAVEELKKREKGVDILINNAGMIPKEIQITDAGWEMSMAVCYIGHFIFTNGLIPLLKVAAAEPKADVRVVNVSSGACYAFFPKNYRWDFTSKQFLAGAVPYEPIKWTYLFKYLFTVNMTIYGQAKMATVLFTRELQRRFDEQHVPIISTSLHPGDINSGDSSLDIFASFTRPIFKGIMITPEKGSFNSLFAATAKVIRQMPDTYKGSYMEPVGRVVVPHPVVKNDKQTRALWDITTQEVNRYLAQNSLTNLEVW